MPDLAFDLRYLRLVILVAEYGSFRAAAESQNLSQSTVSRRVQILEHRLGVTLFERSPHGVQLTALGKRFIQSATVGADYLRQAIVDARMALNGQVGELRIGVLTSLAGGFLPDLLQRYRVAYPAVKLRIEELSCYELDAALLSKEIDVAFAIGEPSIRGCVAARLWSERIIVALPRGHHLAEANNINWRDLKNEKFLVPASPQGADMETFLLRNLPKDCLLPDVEFHGMGRDSLLGMVARGFGVFVSLESLVGSGHKNLSFVPVGSDTDKVPLFGAWRKENGNSAVKVFTDFAIAYSHDRGEI